jgi:RAQPRD family integrative conjugative element protein
MIKRTSQQLIAVALASIMIVIVGVGVVRAQESSATPSDFVYETESLAAELRRLKMQYRGELEEYRRLEDRYTVSKQQHIKLNTLASLEEAIAASQSAMESRARVLKTYLQILKVALLQQTGIDVKQKESAVAAIDGVSEKLTAHHAIFAEPLDKVKLQQVSTNFVLLREEIEDTSYRALSLLTIGQLQTVYDNSSLLVEDMKTELATHGGALKQAERKRGFEETQRNLEAIKPALEEAHQTTANSQDSKYEFAYGRVTKDLRGTYTDLSQILSFLKELLTI